MAAAGSPMAAQAAPSIPPSALYAVGSRLREYTLSTLEQRKPWTELLDRTSFAKPGSLQEAAGRFRTNFNYFRINYLIVVGLCVAGSFLMHPSSLFVLAFLAGSWVYMFAIRQGPLVINGREFSDREKLVLMSVASLLLVFVFSSVGNLLLSTVTFAGALVAVHGATRVPDDLFLEDSGEQAGLLSILTGGSKQPTGAANV